MLASAAGDKPYVTVKAVLLPFACCFDGTVALVSAILVEPKQIHILTEVVDELQARGLTRAPRASKLDAHPGGLRGFCFRQTEFFERCRRFAVTVGGIDPNELGFSWSGLDAIPKGFGIGQPVCLYAVAENGVLGALWEAERRVEVCSKHGARGGQEKEIGGHGLWSLQYSRNFAMRASLMSSFCFWCSEIDLPK